MKNFKVIYNVLVYCLFFIVIAIAFKKFDLLKIIYRTELRDLIILIIFGLGIIGLLSLQLLITLNVFDLRLKYLTSWSLSSMNSLFNYVLPAKTGTVFKGIILKNKYGLIYANYISLLFVTNLLVVITGFMLFMSFAFNYGHINLYGLSLTVCLTLIVILLIYFSNKTKLLKKYLNNTTYLSKIGNGIKICLKNRRKLFFLLILNYIVIVISALRLYWCFLCLDIQIQFLPVLYIQLLTSLSFLFSITPANLFVKEGIILALGNVFLINAEIAIAAALLDRAMSIVSIIIAVIASLPRYKEELKFVNRNTD